MKDNKARSKQKQKRDRTPIIEPFSPELDYVKEKRLREESDALAEMAKPQKKDYHCVAINKDAKVLLKKLNNTFANLQEQIKAIEQRLEEPMPRMARILLLENHNKLMKAAIVNMGQIETDLSAIEKDLYPTLAPEHGKLFSRNKSAVAELYAALKQRSSQIQFKLESIDPILQRAIQPDLELLKKRLKKIERITEETSEIYEGLKGGLISPDLYAKMANKVYEINKKKFDFEQVCKLIEDKLEISKLDAEINQQIEELKTLHERLSTVKGIVDTAYYSIRREKNDLATQLKSADFSFNATDYEVKLPTSSMKWDDDLATREAMINERQNLLAQLVKKRKDIAEVNAVIVTHQQTIKNLIGEDLEFCAKRASLYEAFTNGPHNFYQRFENYQKVLQYDFKKGIDNQQAQWYLHRLLTYTLGFSTDFPDDCIIVRHVRNSSNDLKKSKGQFEKDFPLLTVKSKSEFFNYDGRSYLISDTIRKNIDNYVSARAKIIDAFETGEKWASDTDYVDFKDKLKLLRESKIAIEQYIVAYGHEQKKNRQDLLDVNRELSKSVLKFTLQNDSLEYQGATYVLDIPTQIVVKQYNRAHERLTEALDDKEFSVDPLSFKDKKEQFAALQENQKLIIAFLEEQRKNRLEFLEFTEKLSSVQKITLQEKTLPFEGANYALDYTTQQIVERYNYRYEQLAKDLNDFSLASKPLNAEFLQKIKEGFTQLEEYQKNINAYLEEQRNRRIELLEIQEKFSRFTPFTVQKNALLLQENSFPLDAMTQQRVDRYNRLHDILTTTFRDESISSKVINLESIDKIKADFAQLEDHNRFIVQFIKKQVEFGALIRDFSKYSHLTLNESGNLIYKEKTYLLNAGLKKQVQEYNKTYEQLTLAFKSSENVATIKELLLELQQKSPLHKIDEFSKSMELLQKQSALVQRRADFVKQVIDKIDQEMHKLGLFVPGSEEAAMYNILVALQKTFRDHNTEIDQLAASVNETQEALRLDNLEDSKKQLKSVSSNNQGKVDALILDLSNRFNEDLPKLSSSSYINQFVEWIDKNIIAPLYEAYYKEEKPYKPGFFASSTEVNLFTFRKNLLPDLKKFQNEVSVAAKAASAA